MSHVLSYSAWECFAFCSACSQVLNCFSFIDFQAQLLHELCVGAWQCFGFVRYYFDSFFLFVVWGLRVRISLDYDRLWLLHMRTARDLLIKFLVFLNFCLLCLSLCSELSSVVFLPYVFLSLISISLKCAHLYEEGAPIINMLDYSFFRPMRWFKKNPLRSQSKLSAYVGPLSISMSLENCI